MRPHLLSLNGYIHLLPVLVIAFLQACSSSGSSSSTGTTDDNNSDDQNGDTAIPGELNSANSIAVPDALTSASNAAQFNYTMTSVQGGTTVATAQLFLPVTAAPADGHPLVVWAHGTTGISNACAPSLSFERFLNASAINALLSSGYAVLAPDYEGFGTDSIHPYYNRSSHATAILDAVPAVHQVEGTNLSDDWAIVGHSQGGHVALATARGSIPPAYPLQAVVALAPGTDLLPFSERAFEAIDEKIAEGDFQNATERLFYMNVYAAYVSHAVSEINPSFDPQSIFGEDIAPLIDTAVTETECGSYALSVDRAMSRHFASGGTFSEFEGLKRDWYNVPGMAEQLVMEELGDESQTAPLLIVQGDADRQVPVAATTGFVDRQRSLGTSVTYIVIPGGRHGDVARTNFNETISWLTENFPPD